MASIIAAKAVDVQYEIVGKAQNLEKQVSPDYNVGFVGTAALDTLNTFFTYMEGQGYTATAEGASFVADGTLQARLFSMLSQLSKTGYVALTGTGMPLGEGSGTDFDTSFTALQSAFEAATVAVEAE